MDARKTMIGLLEANRLSKKDAAKLISLETMRPCSVRAVRAWLADPKLSSSRKCPNWAVYVLNKALQKKIGITGE